MLCSSLSVYLYLRILVGILSWNDIRSFINDFFAMALENYHFELYSVTSPSSKTVGSLHETMKRPILEDL